MQLVGVYHSFYWKGVEERCPYLVSVRQQSLVKVRFGLGGYENPREHQLPGILSCLESKVSQTTLEKEHEL